MSVGECVRVCDEPKTAGHCVQKHERSEASLRAGFHRVGRERRILETKALWGDRIFEVRELK